jgi:hypothetical protein
MARPLFDQEKRLLRKEVLYSKYDVIFFNGSFILSQGIRIKMPLDWLAFINYQIGRTTLYPLL